MSESTETVVEGVLSVVPYLTVKGAGDAIEFYRTAFGAIELSRMVEPDGRLGHAEIQIGSSRIMISDEFPEINVFSPETLGGSPVAISLYVKDVDHWANRAVESGAQTLRPVADQGDGLRLGVFRDPFGHRWFIVERTAQDDN